MKTRYLTALLAILAPIALFCAENPLPTTPAGWDTESNREPAMDTRPPELRVTNTWDGSSSTNWHTSSNWSLNHIPNYTEDVVIPIVPANRYPSMSTDGVCNSLFINSGGSLIINDCELDVYTNANINGSFDMTGDSRLRVDQDLIFGANAVVDINIMTPFIFVMEDVEFLAGCSVYMPRVMIDLYGITNSFIRVYEAVVIGEIYAYKPTSGFVSISNLSTHGLTMQNLWVANSTTMYHPYTGTTVVEYSLKFNETSTAHFDAGTISFQGDANASIYDYTSDCYLNNLTINKDAGYSASLQTDLNVRGNLTIQSGTLSCGPHNLKVGGNWNNTLGPTYFTESTGTVTFNGSGTQNLSTETFSTLILNKSGGTMYVPVGKAVNCSVYNWTAGNYAVTGGTFTVADLADPGIFGTILLSSGTINYTQDSAQFIDLRANLTISGGTFNVYGGSSTAFFSYGESATLTMSGTGILDFKNQGIFIPVSPIFNDNISGGTIRTVGSFSCNVAGFNPTGGTIELYGSANCSLANTAGSNLHRLYINKAATREDGKLWQSNNPRDRDLQTEPQMRLNQVTGSGPLDINGNLVINAGIFVAPATINVAGVWYNYQGPDAFVEGTGTVTFDGGGHQYCNYTENFYTLAINKSGGALRVDSSSAVVTCASYTWTAGAVDVLSGTFTANDLSQSDIYGNFYNNTGGTINLYQDSSDNIDLNGYFYNFGGTINIYGGSMSSYWADNANAGITMTGGVIDFKDRGITIAPRPYTLDINVTGGTIRTSGWFYDNRGSVVFAGGEVELYGSSAASVTMGAESSFYNLTINKSGSRSSLAKTTLILPRNHEPEPDSDSRLNDVVINSDILINNNLTIASGLLSNSTFNISIYGDWVNSVGPAAYIAGTGTVYFSKVGGLQNVTGTTNFYNVTDNHSGAALTFAGATGISGTLVVNNIVAFHAANTLGTVLNSAAGGILAFYYDHSSNIGNYTGGGALRAYHSHHVIIDDLTQTGLFGSFTADSGHLEFHQDTTSWIDLNGNMTIANNGIVDIYGGNMNCYIAYNGACTFTMSSGEFNVKNYGVTFYNNGSTGDMVVSGGIIRANGSWDDMWGIFDPTGGIVEMTGSADDLVIPHPSSWFHTLKVNKVATRNSGEPEFSTDREGNVTPITRTCNLTIYACTVKGGFTIDAANVVYLDGTMTSLNAGAVTVNAGSFRLNGYNLVSSGNVQINGVLAVDPGSSLQMYSTKIIDVNSGGELLVAGTTSMAATVSRYSTGYYALNINSGGTLGGHYGIFEWMDANGVYLKAGSAVNTTYPLDYCTFRNGAAGGRLLRIDNNQSFTVTSASFPTNTGSFNVSKSLDTGLVYFAGWSGTFGGTAFEQDAFNRLYWQGSGYPNVKDITIQHVPATSSIKLDWTAYPLPITAYNIYLAGLPDGPFTLLGSSGGNTYSLAVPPGNIYFFRVTAIIPPGPGD